MTVTSGQRVTLAMIDEPLLAELVTVATTGAAADEVTPPLTPGEAWTPERIEWFVDYHRRCRAGLAGPAGEQAWAVLVAGEPVGCVRLKQTCQVGVLETGIWISRSARGAGVGSHAIAAVLAKARAAGGTTLVADTAPGNRASQALLRGTGFTLSGPSDTDDRVRGAKSLTEGGPAALSGGVTGHGNESH